MEEKVWKIKVLKPHLAAKISRDVGISIWTSQLLVNRGVETSEDAKVFLWGDLSRLYSPYLFEDMERAIHRVLRAVRDREKILIYGDYDVDGITSICLLVLALRKLDADVSYDLPHRLNDGYGLNSEAIQRAKSKAVSLIITCDCGMDAYEEIAMAKKEGIDTVVIDHHQMRGELPQALAVLNPHTSFYPFKELAGVGVAYKFLQALKENISFLNIEENLDLVGLGTVADVAPIVGENRILVKHGIESLNSSANKGITALKETAGIKNRRIEVGEIAFILAPRLNASGRMDSAQKSVRMILSSDIEESRRIASLLEEDNRRRQKKEEEILKDAIKMVEEKIDLKEERVLVVAKEGWHPGVIGIVASRLSEKFSRPSILISIESGKGRGSGRSFGGFDLFDNIGQLKGHLLSFGGHKSACGLEILEENVGSFRERLNELAKEAPIEEVTSYFEADSLISLDALSPNVVKEFSLLAPFGVGNEEPLFITKNLEIVSSPKSFGSNHLKFWVKDNRFHREVIGFGRGEYVEILKKGDRINLAYTPQIDLWDGRESVVLKMKMWE